MMAQRPSAAKDRVDLLLRSGGRSGPAAARTKLQGAFRRPVHHLRTQLSRSCQVNRQGCLECLGFGGLSASARARISEGASRDAFEASRPKHAWRSSRSQAKLGPFGLPHRSAPGQLLPTCSEVRHRLQQFGGAALLLQVELSFQQSAQHLWNSKSNGPRARRVNWPSCALRCSARGVLLEGRLFGDPSNPTATARKPKKFSIAPKAFPRGMGGPLGF